MQKNKRYKKIKSLVNAIGFLFIAAVTGCGSGGESSGGNNQIPGGSSDGEWNALKVLQLDSGGLLSPHVQTVATDESIHLAYFSDENYPAKNINYLSFNKDNGQILSTNESVIEIFNNNGLSLALDNTNEPVVTYQAGAIRECGQEMQSDVMFNLRDNDSWQEYTGGIGFVERNPVFQDGLAGADQSMIVDNAGDIHICYQFRYEGCDAMNFNYPDLLYVKKIRNNLSAESEEENVDGNVYNSNGTASVQNNMGEHCQVTLDNEEDPVIFYYGEMGTLDGRKGLRVAIKKNGTWDTDWVEEGVEVGDISTVKWIEGGRLAVAYYVEKYADGREGENLLKYAEKVGDSWQVSVVDDTILCGNENSLAFDSSGNPAIAYYGQKTHAGYVTEDLKLAKFNGFSWDRDVVAYKGDIGHYNKLWFDDNLGTFITTYSNTYDAVYLFNKR